MSKERDGFIDAEFLLRAASSREDDEYFSRLSNMPKPLNPAQAEKDLHSSGREALRVTNRENKLRTALANRPSLPQSSKPKS